MAGKRLANLAFVLLSEARLPDADEIRRTFGDFAASDEYLESKEEDTGKTTRGEGISFELSTGEYSVVALMPVAVPKGEADQGARFSLSSLFKKQWKLPPHCAHLLVTFHATTESPRVVALSRFTSLVAAVTKASPAVGVYWGQAGATHNSEFFLSVASDRGLVPRMMLWSGISIAREKDGRRSFLSLGMKQLDLPDLLLIAGEALTRDALPTMFDLLAYVAKRGKALPEGHTVGRTADERLPVRYVTSPIDSSKKVWRVELP